MARERLSAFALSAGESGRVCAPPLHKTDCKQTEGAAVASQISGPLPARSRKTRIGSKLFLGEVGILSQSLQSKLLTALRERGIRPAADSEEIYRDFQVIGTTSDLLEELAGEERFRPDRPAA